MCGICGVVGIDRLEAAEDVVRRMMDAMCHRGPDDEGVVVASPVALGMRRLSIIDLAGGSQPVFNEEGNLAVVFNGEIYNFQELRCSLESYGHVFRSNSDTEAIVHAFEEWGIECVQRFRGMFAFAIVEMSTDASRVAKRVFLARDRFGIKPLYYVFVDGKLFFASELKALLACGQIPLSLSRSAADGYLLFGSASEPMTMIEGIFSIPPGHRMLVQVDNRPSQARPEAYWDSAAAGRPLASANGHDRPQAVRQTRALLEESVRLHLIADVPLGVFLSSGIDSTALAALASREKPDILTFTVAFPERDFSEAELARRTARQFRTKHQELMLSGEEMLARLDEALAGLDQPSFDGINTYFVSWAARQVGLKVALSGTGGDEIFGGYNTFRRTPRLERLAAIAHSVPESVRAATAAALNRLGEGRKPADAVHKLAALWRNPDCLPHPYFFTRALFTPDQVSSLLVENGHSSRSAPWWAWLAEAVREAGRLDSFGSVSHLETRSYMVSTLLRDTDAVSMAHSLEVRVPFLDHPLAEFVAGLPGSMKYERARPKALLVEALEDLLPAEVIYQRKRTFTFPWERWLRGPLRKRVEGGLSEITPSLRPLLKQDGVRALWQSFLEGRTSWSRPWSVYVLNDWVRRRMDTH